MSAAPVSENGFIRKPVTPEIIRAAFAADWPTLPDSAPRTLAEAYLNSKYPDGPDLLLRFWRGEFWEHRKCVYRRIEDEVLRSLVADFSDEQTIESNDDKSPEPKRYRTNRTRTSDIIDGLQGITQAMVDDMPAWLDAHRPDPQNIIAFQNGLLDIGQFIESGEVFLRPPTPRWFSPNVLPFDLRADSPEPKLWWDFLIDLWPEDPESIEMLQEWFGYAMTTDTRQQKILLMVGPQRSGKGTIARILTSLVGVENVCGPTLSGLATNFGLWGLVNKQLAIVSDARMSGRTDAAIVIERLLSISGEDSLLIDRKNKEPISKRLQSRLMIVSNELPKLMDSSGALADRFLLLVLHKSFLGSEDTNLTDKLTAELPGIALWALNGLRRLAERGHFIVRKAQKMPRKNCTS